MGSSRYLESLCTNALTGADDGKGNSGPSTPSKKARATPKKSGTKMKAETKTCKPEKSAGSDSEAAKMENDDHGFELQGSYVKTEVEWDDDREDYI